MKRIAVILAAIIFGLLLHSQFAHAEIYKWVDEKGTVHFTDDPGMIKLSMEPETAATKKADEAARARILAKTPTAGKLSPAPNQRQYLNVGGKKYELGPNSGRYYETHPEEEYLDKIQEMNKLLTRQPQNQQAQSHKPKSQQLPSEDIWRKSPKPAPNFNESESDTRLFSPATGHILTKQGDGYFDYKTSQTWKETGNGLFNPFTGERMNGTGNGYTDTTTGQTWIKQ